MEQIRIINAVQDDAPMIADAIMDAVGEEIVESLAGERSRTVVHDVFERLARLDNSQYSYLNTRIAVTPDGTKAGVCISYDGNRLLELRKSFFAEACKEFGWNMTTEEMDSMPGDTCGEEFYLDTLATLPAYRHRGIGKALIEDATLKASRAGLPLGLLVSDNNPQARSLYESMGFRFVGRRPFAGEEMSNLRLKHE